VNSSLSCEDQQIIFCVHDGRSGIGSDDVINAAWQAGIGVHALIWVSGS